MCSRGALEKTFECSTCGKWIKDIVQLIDHAATECDEIVPQDALSGSEKSTLLYIEARIVDGQATLNRSQMNYEDDQNLKLFAAARLLDVKGTGPGEGQMNVTMFSDEAWKLAAKCRKERGKSNLSE